MKQYNAKNIRNVAFVGHSGTGKTSLAEAMLFLSGASDRLGRIADGTTVCDFDTEEIKRKASVSMSVAPFEWKNTKINILDTPGLFDFSGGVSEGIRAAGSAVITVSGKAGVSVGAEKGFNVASKKGIAKIFFVNEMDNENADFYKVFEELKSKFGPMVCPLVVPYVENRQVQSYINLVEYKAYSYKDGESTQISMPEMGHRLEGLRTAMNEAVAETSEELMEKYFSGEEFTPDELINGLASGVRKGEIAPVFCGSAYTLEGVDQLMNGLIWLAPYAETMVGETATDKDGNEVELSVDENAPTAAIVFKTIVDPFVGKLLYFKVISGTVSSDTTLVNMRTGATEKIGKLFLVRGKKQVEVPLICAGDIGAVSKLASTNTGDTLCAASRQVILTGIKFELPNLSMAVQAKNKADEEKISIGLSRLMEEDPTIGYVHNHETHERVLSGLGEQHLDVVISKLKSKFGADVTLEVPKVPYRETISKKVKVQGRHKKQSGGHGQFGDVWIEFEPGDNEELDFNETVFGGSVPKNFFPAVEKGLQEASAKGTLAGFPMVGLKATLYDGSYHPVDSSEMAFKLAAHVAYKAGIPQANPVLLEPVGSLKAYVPNDNTGDIMGDINKRRGRVLGMAPSEEDNLTCVEAEVPMAEMGDFSTMVRSLTQGRGYFRFEFARYEEAPQPVAQKVIEANKTDDEG
ncbi:MAG: elongation factor G [Oscillospiraceae bacterium]|nr:elongation factor G [Oscillospiraceae bacterium]MDD4414434.1 elongation factor G [Oscillospiraceae bacterium]